ncbi:MAG: hypothetical protein R3F11_16125 [Verrucomicrobiales bacterium]
MPAQDGRLHHRRSRTSTPRSAARAEPVDLFHAHIGGMDAFARGLKIAQAIIDDFRRLGFRQEPLQLI